MNITKRFLLILCCTIMVSYVFADRANNYFQNNRNIERTGNVPNLVDFQGRLGDSAGNPLTSTETILFSLYDAETGGVALWSETQSVDVVDGLFQVSLGSISSISESDFADPNRWIGITVGTDAEMTPRVRVASVPYALQSGASAPDSDWTIDGDDMYSGVSGNVGIGTSSPAQTLDVDGDASIDGNTFYVDDVNDRVGIGTASPAQTLDVDGDASIDGNTFIVDDVNNRVGIGTGSPESRLELFDGDLSIRRSDNANASNILFRNSGSYYNWRLYNEGGDGTDDFVIAGGTSVQSPTDLIERFRINSDGNVGIGTSSPAQTLDVDGNASIDGNTFYVDDVNNRVGIGTTAPSAELDVRGKIDISAQIPTLNFTSIGTPRISFIENGFNLNSLTDVYTSFNLSDLSNEGTNEIMRIRGDGKVGIGTTNPDSTLHIVGGALIAGGIRGEGTFNLTDGDQKASINTNSTNGYIQLDVGGTGHASDAIYIGDINNSSNEVYMLGNVGIGMNTPINKLTVSGDANFTGYVGIGDATPDFKLDVVENIAGTVMFIKNSHNTNSVDCDGLKIEAGHDNYNSSFKSEIILFQRPDNTNLGEIVQNSSNSVSYSTSSDRRLKNNIRDTHYGLTNLMQVQVADYYFKDDSKTLMTGFIAQQLFEHYPPAVNEGGDDPKTEPWNVEYGALTPLLVKAVQDQQAVIEEQQKQIDELKLMVSRLIENK